MRMRKDPDAKRYHVAIGASWGMVAYSLAYTYGWQDGKSERWWVSDFPRDIANDLKAKPRYSFALNWSHRIPDEMLTKSEWVNFHCTNLPKGRGGHPIENLILEGQTTTVITAHRMTPEMDAGPIYTQSEPISLHGTKSEITERFIEPVAKMMRWIIDTEPTPKPQRGTPTYYKRLSPERYKAVWSARG